MTWRPCEDLSLNTLYPSKIWNILQSIYDNAYATAPLPRYKDNKTKLINDYIIGRQGVSEANIKTGLSALPPWLRKYRLGVFEIDILDWLFNSPSDRILMVTGPRGAGKSTFLHYIEYLLSQSNKIETPFLIFLDMCSKNESSALINEEYFAKDLGNELYQKALLISNTSLFSSLKEALFSAGLQLKSNPDYSSIIEELANIRNLMQWDDQRSLVLIIDNIDHLHFRSVEFCLQICRDILLKAGVGSIISVRPSMYNRIIEQNSSRTYVSALLRITPPSLQAWLRDFSGRMLRSYKLEIGRRRKIVINDITITTKKSQEIFNRIANLCWLRAQKDDTQRFMEALSSHDMRHFNMLIRRMLQNRSIPSNWILGLSDDGDTPGFHPMFAMMQGERRWFMHNNYIPNLLEATPPNRKTSFLLFHRLLSIIRDKKPPMEINEISLCMEEYDYDLQETFFGLEVMRRANVIYGSDLETEWSIKQKPEYCGLTESGVYFLKFLFSDPDYLSSAVLDTHLEHEYLSRHLDDDMFAPQIYSLHEFFIAVKNEENRQFSFMRKRPPSERLALAADRLRHGNTFTNKILKGFKDIVSRGTNSISLSAQMICRSLKPKIEEYDKAVESLEQALDEILNRAMKRKILYIPTNGSFTLQDFNDSIEVNYRQDGNKLDAEFNVNSKNASFGSVIYEIKNKEGEKSFREACLTKAISLEREPYLSGKMKDIPVEEISKMFRRLSAYFISIPSFSNRYTNFFSMLSILNDKPNIRIKLNIFRNETMEEYLLGNEINYSQLNSWSLEKLKIIESRAKKKSLESNIIKGFGLELSQKVISQKGLSTLISLMKQIKKCWLITDIREIPWEWLTIEDAENMVSLCDEWDIYRTHHNHRTFIYSYPVKKPLNDMKTIGLKKEKNKMWRTLTPKKPSQVLKQISTKGIVHIVAHAEKPGELKFNTSDDWSLTKIDIIGYKLIEGKSPQVMIVSSCESGAVRDPDNIIVEISRKYKCPTWAPLLKIEKFHADDLDSQLGKLFYNKKLKDLFKAIKAIRQTKPFAYIYVCYLS